MLGFVSAATSLPAASMTSPSVNSVASIDKERVTESAPNASRIVPPSRLESKLIEIADWDAELNGDGFVGRWGWGRDVYKCGVDALTLVSPRIDVRHAVVVATGNPRKRSTPLVMLTHTIDIDDC